MNVRSINNDGISSHANGYTIPLKYQTIVVAATTALLVSIGGFIVLSGGSGGVWNAMFAVVGMGLCLLFATMSRNQLAATVLYVCMTCSFFAYSTHSPIFLSLALLCQMALSIVLISLFEFGRMRLLVFTIIALLLFGGWYHFDALTADSTTSLSTFLSTLTIILVTLGTSIFAQRRIHSGVHLLELANTELTAANQTLTRESESRRNIIRALPGSVIITTYDVEPHILWCNSETIQMLKMPEQTLLDQPIVNYWSDPKWLPQVVEQLVEYDIVRNFRAKAVDANGVVHSVVGNIHTIRYQGEPAFLWMLDDVTALRNAERIIEQSRRMDNMGVMAGKVTHDFNNLLSIISLTMDVGAARLEPDHPSRKYFRQASSAAQEASELVQEMRGYAQLGRVVTESVDSQDFLQTIAEKVAVSTPEGIDFRPRIPQELPQINIDCKKMERVLLNLIFNAFDAIGEETYGIVQLTAETRTMTADQSTKLANYAGNQLKSGAYVCVSVSDTGSGIDDDTVKRIFEPFFTTKKKGSGLGLAAAQGIVQNHNGGILVDSSIGDGTTFTLLLPAYIER